MPSEKTQRDFESLSRVIRDVGAAASSGARLDDISKKLGVKMNRKELRFSGAGELTGELQGKGNAKDLPAAYQAALIGQLSLYGGLHVELNRHLRREARINVQAVIEASDKKESRASGGERAEILVAYDSGARISYDRFKRKIEIRKVGKYKKTKDPIHIGASPNFRRYAITRVTLPVRGQQPAGRKGTPLQGLGLEPVGTKDKRSVGYPSPAYKAFIRRGYPGRKSPDTLTTSYKFPVYTEILNDSTLRAKVMKPVLQNIKRYTSQWKKSVVKAIVDAVSNVDKTINNRN